MSPTQTEVENGKTVKAVWAELGEPLRIIGSDASGILNGYGDQPISICVLEIEAVSHKNDGEGAEA